MKWVPFLATVAFAVGPVQAAKVVWFDRDQVKAHFEVVEKLDPKQTHLFDKLMKRFGKKDQYSLDEVVAIESPKVPDPHPVLFPNEPRTEKVPVDGFTPQQAEEHFRTEKLINPKAKGSMAALHKVFDVPGRPPQSWYRASEIRQIDKFGAEIPPTMVDREKTPLVKEAEEKAKVERSIFVDGWKTPRVRADWTDAMSDEDPSLGAAAKTKVGDLVGATFSYVRDGKKDTDTWSAKGAVIVPWVWMAPTPGAGFTPELLAFAPSVSLQKVSTNGSPTGEVDQLFYRLGVFSTWTNLLGQGSELELRGAAVYLTDTDHKAQLNGFEFDLEPRFLFGQTEDHESKVKLGYSNILIPKGPLNDNGDDRAVWDYQVRVWLHAEGGEVESLGKTWAATPDSFFRLGPSVQLRMNWHKLLLGRDVSLTAKYSYLAAVSGPDLHNSLYSIDATWVLLQDDEMRRKVTLNVNYTNGGLDFTKEDVDQLTVTLGVLF
jgi:hypothetical protein